MYVHILWICEEQEYTCKTEILTKTCAKRVYIERLALNKLLLKKVFDALGHLLK